MTGPDKIRKVIQSYTWERWLERPYGTFFISTFAGGNSRAVMRRFGVDAEYRSCLFQDGWWYESPDVTVPFAAELTRYLQKGGSVTRIVRACERTYRNGLAAVRREVMRDHSWHKKLEVLHDVTASVVPFVWLAHGFEDVFTHRLNQEVPKYVKGDVATWIGDVTLPKKKVATGRMEDAMRRGAHPANIQKRFGWIKTRDAFSDPFTIDEITAEQRNLIRQPKPTLHRRVVPAPLRKLVSNAQDIVYLRTLRTDAIFHLLYEARPILRNAAAAHDMTFHELSDYSIHDLIEGRPVRYPTTVFATDGADFAFFKKPLISTNIDVAKQVRGTIAFHGIVRGTARIVKHARETDKVKRGDILIAPMTFPSLIMAMQRAAAFVTDEGGLTCHAAIVAREMHKPCIVGTKHATQVLKDGDRVEVDATKGIVRNIG